MVNACTTYHGPAPRPTTRPCSGCPSCPDHLDTTHCAPTLATVADLFHGQRLAVMPPASSSDISAMRLRVCKRLREVRPGLGMQML